MTDSSWEEVDQALKENRHELVIHGPKISNKISKYGIDPKLFTVLSLNYLNITNTCLVNIPSELGNLQNLTNLVLHSNSISSLPDNISKLTKLKVLDCSRNQLKSLPEDIDNLPQLTTLNLSANLLQSLPIQKNNLKLSILDLSHNEFSEFPDICYPELGHLAELKLNDNKIEEIPSNISVLTSLKLLDLGNNQIKGNLYVFLERKIVNACVPMTLLIYEFYGMLMQSWLFLSSFLQFVYNLHSSNLDHYTSRKNYF